MGKKMRKLAAVVGMVFQGMLMLLFGFTELPVSTGVYMAGWCACAILISRTLHIRDRNVNAALENKLIIEAKSLNIG